MRYLFLLLFALAACTYEQVDAFLNDPAWNEIDDIEPDEEEVEPTPASDEYELNDV